MHACQSNAKWHGWIVTAVQWGDYRRGSIIHVLGAFVLSPHHVNRSNKRLSCLQAARMQVTPIGKTHGSTAHPLVLVGTDSSIAQKMTRWDTLVEVKSLHDSMRGASS